jgi:uncharacterized protein (TIGR02271 family)
MAQTVVGFFDSTDEAQRVKNALISKGFTAQDITVVAKNGGGYAEGRTGTTTGSSGEGIGQKISNFFRSLTGADTDDERYYTEGINRGGAVVAVTVPDDRADDAADLLDSYGAKDVEERSASPSATSPAASTSSAGSSTKASTRGTGQDQVSIPVVKEELKVGKRQVKRGGVRVYSHVTERPVEADVQLREEHVRVERRPVDRPATEADLNAAREQTIEMTETAEEAVIGKTTRVVEEVVVGKEATERKETVRDTVRRTEVEVEDVGAGRTGPARSFKDDEEYFRNHYKTNYASSGASYERYSPAYEYGYTLANDPRYRSSDWASVESQARTDWASKGHGTWEDFKAAIRHGWDRVRGRR